MGFLGHLHRDGRGIPATLVLAVALTAPATALADQPLGVGLGAVVSTLGVGGELSYSFNDHFRTRVGGYGYNFDFDGEESGIEYDGDLDLSSAAAWLDWFPFGGSFRVTGGWLSHDNGIKARGVPGPGDSFEIGGTDFGADEVGTLSAKADFGSSAPYLGLGWDFGRSDGGLVMQVDLGVMFQDSPDVTLSSRGGTLSNDPVLLEALDREAAELEDDVDKYELYPVLSIGVSYLF